MPDRHPISVKDILPGDFIVQDDRCWFVIAIGMPTTLNDDIYVTWLDQGALLSGYYYIRSHRFTILERP